MMREGDNSSGGVRMKIGVGNCPIACGTIAGSFRMVG